MRECHENTETRVSGLLCCYCVDTGAARTILMGANIHIFVFYLLNFSSDRLFLQSVNTNIQYKYFPLQLSFCQRQCVSREKVVKSRLMCPISIPIIVHVLYFILL